MKRSFIIIVSLACALFGAVSCEESYGVFEDNEVIPVFEGIIETTQAVDLGLSVKWAGYNVGAEAPEQPGNYFASHQADPVAADLNAEGYTFDPAATDPVTANWAGSWRMPTKAQVEELAKLQIEKVIYNGTKGYVVTANNGKSIFFPMAGYKSGGKVSNSTAVQFWYNDPASETGGEIAAFGSYTKVLEEKDEEGNTISKVVPDYRLTATTTAYPYLGFPLRGVCD